MYDKSLMRREITLPITLKPMLRTQMYQHNVHRNGHIYMYGPTFVSNYPYTGRFILQTQNIKNTHIHTQTFVLFYFSHMRIN